MDCSFLHGDAGIEIPFPYRTLTFKDSLRTQTVNPIEESKEKKSALFWFVSTDLLSYLTVMPIWAYRPQVGQREINANKNPEFLVSSPGQLLVCACTYDRCGDFAFLCYHFNR
jgi:hypothetical protein